MKKVSLIILILLTGFVWAVNFNGRPANKNSINPVLGNASFVQKYGHEPGMEAGEDERIQTHLLYAEELLRNKNTDHLPVAVAENRNHLLNLLHNYAIAKKFPKNYDYPGERKPCFIDRDANICAVGYLVEQTAGRDAAIAINNKYQYETIAAMKGDALLTGWVAQSGLTLEECAMIQPTYGWPITPAPDPQPAPNDQVISKAYGVTTGISGGINIALNAINQFQIRNGGKSKLVPVMGLATGAFSIINGIRHYPRKPITVGYVTEDANDTKKLISVGNIALGSVSMMLSTWNLLKNKKRPEAKKITWQPYYQPLADGKAAYGVGVTKRIG
jgi:hypothetical protein